MKSVLARVKVLEDRERLRLRGDLVDKFDELMGDFTPDEIRILREGAYLQALKLDTPENVTPEMMAVFSKYIRCGASDLASKINETMPVDEASRWQDDFMREAWSYAYVAGLA